MATSPEFPTEVPVPYEGATAGQETHEHRNFSSVLPDALGAFVGTCAMVKAGVELAGSTPTENIKDMALGLGAVGLAYVVASINHLRK